MFKQIIFEADKNSIIFKDSKSEKNFYSMTRDVLQEKMKITEEYGRREKNVPDEFTIKVSPLRKVEPKNSFTEVYRPLVTELIDFPINRIEWMFIRIDNSSSF